MLLYNWYLNNVKIPINSLSVVDMFNIYFFLYKLSTHRINRGGKDDLDLQTACHMNESCLLICYALLRHRFYGLTTSCPRPPMAPPSRLQRATKGKTEGLLEIISLFSNEA